MKLGYQHIAVVLALVMAVFSSCGKGEAEVIPRKKMAEIYAEMLLTDQWITATPGVRRMADTSLVYEPILEKYGYDSDDYLRSIDVYMNDPERFSRIFRSSAEIIGEQIEELKRLQAIEEAKSKLPKIESDFRVEDFLPYWKGEHYVHYHDSLDIAVDSTTLTYRFIPVETADTLYDGLRMRIPALDSLKNRRNDPLKLDSLKTLLKSMRNDSANKFKTK